jgi:terminase, large subunit
MTASSLADDLRQVRCEALAPPPLLSLSQWSDQYARIPTASNASPGRWRPYQFQREWLDVISDPAVHEISIMKSARVGYTRCLLNAICFYIHQDPSPILAVFPRVEDSEEFSRSDLLNTLLETPVTAALVGDIKSRDANQRILKRTFKSGASITFVGANSPAGFRRISARIILLDETDGFPHGVGDEGDQTSLARKRGETFWNRKLISGSTPTLKYQSRIEKAFLDGDQRRYFVPCPGCGHEQTLRFENLHWDKTLTGEHLPHTAHFVCVRNGCIINESDKPAMIAAGKWIAEKPFFGHASFHLWTAYSPHPNASWANIAREFLAATKDPVLLKTFANVTLGEPWEDRSSARPWEELRDRARASNYKKGTVPEGAALLFLGCDCQLSSIEYLLTARGSNNRKFVIDYGVIHWPISEADGQRALNQLLRRQWTNYAGLPMGITMAAIDAGYETSHVLEFCCHSRFVGQL